MNFKLTIVSNTGNEQKEEIVSIDPITFKSDKDFKSKILKLDDEAQALTARWNADGDEDSFAYVNIELATPDARNLKVLKEFEIYVENVLDDRA
jgi:hypothetical protein